MHGHAVQRGNQVTGAKLPARSRQCFCNDRYGSLGQAVGVNLISGDE